jgi:hypothetical protein
MQVPEAGKQLRRSSSPSPADSDAALPSPQRGGQHLELARSSTLKPAVRLAIGGASLTLLRP